MIFFHTFYNKTKYKKSKFQTFFFFSLYFPPTKHNQNEQSYRLGALAWLACILNETKQAKLKIENLDLVTQSAAKPRLKNSLDRLGTIILT